MYATCDDGSCYYTTQSYYTPNTSGNVGCFACEIPGSGCGPALPNCPTFYNGSQNVPDFWTAGCDPSVAYNPSDPLSCGNIYTNITTCNNNGGAQ